MAPQRLLTALAVFAVLLAAASCGVHAQDDDNAVAAELANVRAQLAEMTSKYQETLAEKMALKHEVASLEEQLMAKTSSGGGGGAGGGHPDAKELLQQIGALALETASEVTSQAVNFTKPAVAAVGTHVMAAWNTSEEYMRTAAPRVRGMYDAAEKAVGPAMSQASDKVHAALAAVGLMAARLQAQAGPLVRDLHDKAKPHVAAAAAAAAKVFAELQAAALREALKVEALAPYATEDNARIAVSVMLGLPAAWVALTLLGWMFRRGPTKVRVKKSVAKGSVPLRTPTPEKRTKPRVPFGAGNGGGNGVGGSFKSPGTITSPDGEDVLRFA
mmetsp:Transcript_37662/g.93259  ORF Transcript_37662/g.93259 Transcript_37662/m.93259 type:complete len:330 (+) Transcript_37662:44-1033(+)